MLWIKSRQSVHSIDSHFQLRLKKYLLKKRAAAACRDNTNYQLRLETLLSNNKNNVRLITKAVGYISYLREQDVPIQQAAKETLELIKEDRDVSK